MEAPITRPAGTARRRVARKASPARTAVSRSSLEPISISVPDSSMSIANPSEANTGKGCDAGSIQCRPVRPSRIPPTSSPTSTGTRGRLLAASNGPSSPASTTSASEVYIGSL